MKTAASIDAAFYVEIILQIISQQSFTPREICLYLYYTNNIKLFGFNYK